MSGLESISPSYDAIVIGARAAGASTAMLLARQGLRVLAVDKSREGSDTLSTHALMRAGVMQLHGWGVLDAIRNAGTPAVRTTTFHYADEAVQVLIKERDGVDALYAPRRTVLDQALVNAAREAGAEVLHGVRLMNLTRSGDGRVNGAVLRDGDGGSMTVAARIVIGADGLHSRVAHLAGAGVEHRTANPSATIYGYLPLSGDGGYHWHYGHGVSVGAIPTNHGAMCVFVSTTPDRFQAELPRGVETLYRRLLSEGAPELAERTVDSIPQERLHPFAGADGLLRRAWGPGWALVGDAGYFKDPITAHGITDALVDADSLARAVARGGDEALEDYRIERNRRAIEFMDLTDSIASFDWTLEEARVYHLRLSKLMNEEVQVLRESLEPEPKPVTV